MSEAKPFASLSSGLLARKGAAKPAMRRPNFNMEPDNFSSNFSEEGQDDLGWNDMGYDVNPDISQEAPVEKPLFNPLAKAIETPKPEVKQQQERIAAQLQASNSFDDPAENESDRYDASDKEPIALHPNTYISRGEPQSEAQLKTDSDAKPVSPLLVKKAQGEASQPTVLRDNSSETSAAALLVKSPAKLLAKSPVKAKRTAAKAGTAKSKAAFTLRLDRERHLKLRLACAINNISAQKFVTEALDKKLSEMEQINMLSDQIGGDA